MARLRCGSGAAPQEGAVQMEGWMGFEGLMAIGHVPNIVLGGLPCSHHSQQGVSCLTVTAALQ